MSGQRRGTTILEATTALALLAAVAAGTSRALLVAAGQQRATWRQTTAQLEAANVLERVMAMPWGDVGTERLGNLSLAPEAQTALPEARLALEVTRSKQPLLCKRIVVEVSWQQRAERRARVRMTAWKFHTEGIAP